MHLTGEALEGYYKKVFWQAGVGLVVAKAMRVASGIRLYPRVSTRKYGSQKRDSVAT